MEDKNLLKEALKQYKKEDYVVRSWVEYEPELKQLMDKIVAYVKEKKLIIDAVVPILRGGNIPATFLAYKLNILTILPVQYKYFFLPGVCELRQIAGIDSTRITKENPVFLLIEGNHCYGNQAKYAAADLKKSFPKSHIIYGASNMDYSYQDVVKDADVSFYGTLTNCCKELTDEACKKLGIENKKELLFPWESIEEEWDIVELKQRKYMNLDTIRKNAPLIATYDLT